jgi:hypothetical protein
MEPIYKKALGLSSDVTPEETDELHDLLNDVIETGATFDDIFSCLIDLFEQNIVCGS